MGCKVIAGLKFPTELEKKKKKFPFDEIVEPRAAKGISTQSNIYSTH